MNELKRILEYLRDGGKLTLEVTENQYNEEIDVKELVFTGGEWVVTELNCRNSSSLGMGTCGCHTHNPYVTYTVDRKAALKEIKTVVEKEIEDENKREEEIRFLDELIESLS